MISGRFILAIVCLFIAYLSYQYTKEQKSTEDEIEESIIKAWHNLIVEPDKRFSRVAVGTNACLDLIVKGVDLLRELNISPGEAEDHAALYSIDDLQEVFALHLSRGAGAERSFMNDTAFDVVVQAATKLTHKEWFVGGNAALIGQKVVSTFPDVKVQLVGPIGPKLQSMLHQSIQVPESSLIPKDEVHLIMEYKVGERWGEYVTPIATRFITSHDIPNAQAQPLENFFDSLLSFSPDLVVLSGLHMLEGQPEHIWNERISVLRQRLQGLPRNLPVHLELASMAEPAFLKHIIEQIFPYITAIGLNEQELALTSAAGQGPHTDLLEGEGHPPIFKVTEIMEWILNTYGYSSSNPNSRLTRVHFHCLSFHILTTVTGAWENANSAVAAGTQMAGRQACDIDTLQTEKIELRIPEKFLPHPELEEHIFNPEDPIIQWSVRQLSFSLSPVLVCKHPLKTVGLGDAISATGLLYSQFNPEFNT